MSEQYPLLCDEVTEEDRFSPRSQHRRLLMSRGRVRNHVKGAAAIITRWPEHWTTLLTYWWIGIGMIAITTYILYNCLFSYAMLPPANKLYPKPFKNNFKPSKFSSKSSLQPKVFMHIFVDEKQDVDLNNYLPYIDIITNKYQHFKYELIIVANDTNAETKDLSDAENNKLALNALLADDFNHNKLLTNTAVHKNSNLNIRYVTLSSYLYDSPLKKHWQSLPSQFMKFLVRAVSIWEKGGIAFDPIVLTPQSPHSIYIDKVYNILKKYKIKKGKLNTTPTLPKKSNPNDNKKNIKPKPNNIRDIINTLELEDITKNGYLEPLLEAETKTNSTIIVGSNLQSVDNDESDTKENETNSMKLTDRRYVKSSDVTEKSTKEKQSESKVNLLPLFLDYLFQNKQTKPPNEINTLPKRENQPKDIEKSNENKSLSISLSDIMDQPSYKPMIISAKGIYDVSDKATKLANITEVENDDLFEVTIDLKGNIIVTDTPCHAFIGSLFTNVIHHDQSESVTDFIIKELSIFCKGLLATCVGIDVILL